MSITRMISCAALAAVLVAIARPAPADAQIGGLIKRKLKEKAVETAVGSAPAAAKGARTTPPAPGPRFTEDVLEMTPELLDRFEKGLAAEAAVQDEIDRQLGKLLTPDEYDRCEKAVLSSPEGQKIYMEAGDLIPDEATQEQLQKASQELARRFARIVRPKCGLDTREAQQVRDQHANRLEEAGPAASGLTKLQLWILKERVLPFCAAAESLAALSGEVRVPTGSQAVYWVYTTREMEALQPRCSRLTGALQRRA